MGAGYCDVLDITLVLVEIWICGISRFANAWPLAPDVAEQRLMASQRSLAGIAANAADDGDRSGDDR